MSYALYLDPSCKNMIAPALPDAVLAGEPHVAYWRLIDLDEEALGQFNPSSLPQAHDTIAEIHPAQLAQLSPALMGSITRLSIVQEKSTFSDMAQFRAVLDDMPCDITYEWDNRFHVDYYIKMLRYWIQCGAPHFSFYELSQFPKWQRLKQFLADQGYVFYDRYHACKPNHESRYQKHLAQFGDLYALGGFSRVTQDGVTRVKSAAASEWDTLSVSDQLAECLLFAMADSDGIELADLDPAGVARAMAAGLAEKQGTHLVPTEKGLWDTVALVSHLHQK